MQVSRRWSRVGTPSADHPRGFLGSAWLQGLRHHLGGPSVLREPICTPQLPPTQVLPRPTQGLPAQGLGHPGSRSRAGHTVPSGWAVSKLIPEVNHRPGVAKSPQGWNSQPQPEPEAGASPCVGGSVLCPPGRTQHQRRSSPQGA